MQIKNIPISKIRCNEWNPNEMSDKMKLLLRDNILKLGFIDPILVIQQNDEYRIIDGEHRYKMAQEMDLKRIPVVIVEQDITETEQKKQTIRLNQIKGQINYEKFNKLVDNLYNNILPTNAAFDLGFESDIEMNILRPLTDKEYDSINKPQYISEHDTLKHIYKILEDYLDKSTDGCLLIITISGNESLVFDLSEEEYGQLKQLMLLLSAKNKELEYELAYYILQSLEDL
jgi:hypothetical protein